MARTKPSPFVADDAKLTPMGHVASRRWVRGLTTAAWLLSSPRLAMASPSATAAGARGAKEILAVAPRASPSGYRIDAVRVGVSPDAKRSLFIADPTLPPRIEIAFSFWLLRGFGRVILVDTGYVDPKMNARWRVRGYRGPVAGLATLGVTPRQVTDIIITHNHWDHIGGLVRFGHGAVWITGRDYDDIHQWARTHDSELFATLNAAREQGRLHRTARLQQIAPSVIVVPVGLHTPGFQYVVVNNAGGVWVLASDIGPLRRNFARREPTGLTTNAEAARAVLDVMIELVGGDLSRIVPGHEPALFATTDVTLLTGGDDPTAPVP